MVTRRARARLPGLRRALALVGDRHRGLLGRDLGLLRRPLAHAVRAGARLARRCPARSGSRARRSTTPSTCSAATMIATPSRSSPTPRPATTRELTFGELREQVARARAGLKRLGVGPGDRVVAYLPNIPETLVAFLAAASLGAVWATCAPEFGVRSVVDRFGQLDPKVLLAVSGYVYGEKLIDRAEKSRRSASGCRRSSGRRRRLSGRTRCPDAIAWDELLSEPRAARVRAGAVRPPALRPVLLGHDRPAEGDRARPRRDPARAPEEPRAGLGPPARATG